MITHERSVLILRLLRERGVLTIALLAELIGDVSEVTIRRDANRLAKLGLLKRTRGGVVNVDDVEERDYAAAERPGLADSDASAFEMFDAVVLSPVEGRGALALRNQIKRLPVPFIAESAPQDGGVYLGPNNWAVGYALGCHAARDAGTVSAAVLVVTHQGLPNTVARADGFIAGLKDVFGREPRVFRVNGIGEYRFAFSAAKDALQAHPDISMVFGVNDHSILAALDAADECGRDAITAYSVGGEGDAILAALRHDKSRLHACAALFPQLVGRKAIDLVALALEGKKLPGEVFTPFAILTRSNVDDYYERRDGKFELRPAMVAKLDTGPAAQPRPQDGRRAKVNFMPHFPAHDWYRNMTRAMQARADALGLDLVVSAPQAGIAREIKRLRQSIAAEAAKRVGKGDTILIGAGEVCVLLARELRSKTGLTVVTNSFAILKTLNGVAGIKVILTAGEYQEKDNCLVGPSLAALFEMMRVDCAFLSVDGVSADFGLTSADERVARALQRFVHAARSVTVLADHTLVGLDANHRIAEIGSASELITDSGTLPAQRLALSDQGVRVTLADEVDGPPVHNYPIYHDDTSTSRQADPEGTGLGVN